MFCAQCGYRSCGLSVLSGVLLSSSMPPAVEPQASTPHRSAPVGCQEPGSQQLDADGIGSDPGCHLSEKECDYLTEAVVLDLTVGVQLVA